MSKIQQQVMASVLVVYALRKATSPFALKAYALVAATFALVLTVSVPHILNNLMQVGLSGLGDFVVSAIRSTTLTVQAMTLVACLMGVLLVRDTLRTTSRTFSN